MAIRTKRWNDPVEPGDGDRLLVCSLRGSPSGSRKRFESMGAVVRRRCVRGREHVSSDGNGDDRDLVPLRMKNTQKAVLA
jgi:hypothetical protein